MAYSYLLNTLKWDPKHVFEVFVKMSGLFIIHFFAAGCRSEKYLNYTWPDTGVGAIASAPCPCAEILGMFAGKVTRQCTVAPRGAEWSPDVDLSRCEVVLSQVSQQLCEIALVNACCSRIGEIRVRKLGAYPEGYSGCLSTLID